MRIAADGGGQHRQAGDHRFEQDRAGVFVVRRMDEQVGAEQKAQDVAASRAGC
jgi:hypothetical protein